MSETATTPLKLPASFLASSNSVALAMPQLATLPPAILQELEALFAALGGNLGSQVNVEVLVTTILQAFQKTGTWLGILEALDANASKIFHSRLEAFAVQLLLAYAIRQARKA